MIMTIFLTGLPKPRTNIFTLYTVIIVLAFLVMGFILLRAAAKKEAEPVKSVPVKLIKKKKTYEYYPHRIPISVFWLIFLTENDELIEIRADSELYDFYNEGECGNLTYKGAKMIKFERVQVNPQK